jgi:hypothetical protein
MEPKNSRQRPAMRVAFRFSCLCPSLRPSLGRGELGGMSRLQIDQLGMQVSGELARGRLFEPGQDAQTGRVDQGREGGEVGVARQHRRVDLIGDPADQHAPRALDTLDRQQGVVDAAELQTDDQDHGQPERLGDVADEERRPQRHAPAADALDDDLIGLSASVR